MSNCSVFINLAKNDGYEELDVFASSRDNRSVRSKEGGVYGIHGWAKEDNTGQTSV